MSFVFENVSKQFLNQNESKHAKSPGAFAPGDSLTSPPAYPPGQTGR